jgi:hypothetical protein
MMNLEDFSIRTLKAGPRNYAKDIMRHTQIKHLWEIVTLIISLLGCVWGEKQMPRGM